MTTDNTVDLHIIKISRPEIVSFDCHPGLADLRSNEGCCCGLTKHTYDFLAKAGNIIVCCIAGLAYTGPVEQDKYYDVELESLYNGQWYYKGTFSIHTNRENPTPFEWDWYPFAAEGIRLRMKDYGYLDMSLGLIQFGLHPITDITNEQECASMNGHYYNGRCHLLPPTCSQINNQQDCVNRGCYWTGTECQPIPEACTGWCTEQDCIDAGCEWWGPDNPYLPNTCHETGMKAVSLNVDPDQPADIHSNELPGTSGVVSFNLPNRVKAYRAIGTIMLAYPGHQGVTDCNFYMDAYGMWQNRIRISFNIAKDFDEDFNKTSEYKRYGTVFKIGSGYGELTVDSLNMIFIYKDA